MLTTVPPTSMLVCRTPRCSASRRPGWFGRWVLDWSTIGNRESVALPIWPFPGLSLGPYDHSMPSRSANHPGWSIPPLWWRNRSTSCIRTTSASQDSISRAICSSPRPRGPSPEWMLNVSTRSVTSDCGTHVTLGNRGALGARRNSGGAGTICCAGTNSVEGTISGDPPSAGSTADPATSATGTSAPTNGSSGCATSASAVRNSPTMRAARHGRRPAGPRLWLVTSPPVLRGKW